MTSPSSKTAILACTLAVFAATVPDAVSAHGSMSVPKPTFAIQGDTTQFGGTVDSSALTAPAGMSFTTDPESNTKAFTAAIKTSSYKSVRDLINAKGVMISGATKQCGITSATGSPQPLPDKYVEWSHGASEGFTPSHQGPCEVWCDDALAFTNDNCAKNYPTAPAKLPFDHSKCVGKKMLTTIWLALHSPTWQAYINCAPLEGSTASGSSTEASSTGADADASSSDSGAATTGAPPASGSDDEYAPTPAPSSASTGSSASKSKKCKTKESTKARSLRS